MTQRNRILKALSVLLPAGALGASVALASTAAQATTVSNRSTAPQSVAGAGVSARLEAIRSGVSAISGLDAVKVAADSDVTLAWWGNAGFGPWHLGWGNGGWGNWHNGWHNGGWGNWHNGWGNGGWHNYWHNW
jgi:rSAM-associated Gly-rich repeat protein